MGILNDRKLDRRYQKQNYQLPPRGTRGTVGFFWRNTMYGNINVRDFPIRGSFCEIGLDYRETN